MQSVSFAAAAEFTEECFAQANQQVVPIVKVPKFQDGALVSHGVGHTQLKLFLLVIELSEEKLAVDGDHGLRKEAECRAKCSRCRHGSIGGLQ